MSKIIFRNVAEKIVTIEQHKERAGLAEVAGMWPEFDDLAEALGVIAELRWQGGSGLKLENRLYG